MMEKKRLALITLHAVKNYGSVLQTYATQCFFKKLGFNVEVIDFRRKWETKGGYWFALPQRRLTEILRQALYTPSKVIQKKVFDRFLNKKIHRTKNTYTDNRDFYSHPINADVYCTGSDQVWNSGWNDGVILPYYLSFVKNNPKIKKISFAASFGEEGIDQKEKKRIEPLLRDYDLITVREKCSVEMRRKEFGIEAELLLDPTLMMDASFWRKCKKEISIGYDDYVLLIQLNRNKKFDELAVSYARQENKPLVRLCLRVDQLILPGKHVLLPEVEQYISLIDQASCVLTDSFHATSFCINLNKQFYCYYPDHYSSRLSSILEIMNMEDRRIINNCIRTSKQIDYCRINKLLNEKRTNAKSIIVRHLSERGEMFK